ncbi:relaxase/mobilization nuclease domain-containing protein [Huintestinicola sp.]|uniref:relaxase/mobilization nuclease domain-containing protein n=1 Tax=Huintestinicola sp. TaxID=2981661 RepID=UPI003D7E786B
MYIYNIYIISACIRFVKGDMNFFIKKRYLSVTPQLRSLQTILIFFIDKNHIHNHFAVCPLSLNGKRWIDNKKTLEYCRNISDNIHCLKPGKAYARSV